MQTGFARLECERPRFIGFAFDIIFAGTGNGVFGALSGLALPENPDGDPVALAFRDEVQLQRFFRFDLPSGAGNLRPRLGEVAQQKRLPAAVEHPEIVGRDEDRIPVRGFSILAIKSSFVRVNAKGSALPSRSTRETLAFSAYFSNSGSSGSADSLK